MADTTGFYASLGRRLCDLRRKEGLTQQQLGARLEPAVTRASIANIEAGKQGVLVHTLVQLAKALNTEVADLIPSGIDRVPVADLRAKVQTELLAKLSVPHETSRRLAEKLLARPMIRRKAR